MRFLLLFFMVFVTFLPRPLHAAQDNELLYKANPQLLLNNPRENIASLSKPQLLDLYYQECTSGSTASLKKYNEWQCACTASRMDQFMDHDALAKFFDKSTRTNTQRGRAMYLGYIPCLEATVTTLVQDTCSATNPGMCDCVAARTGKYVYESGNVLIPGFIRGRYITANAPRDPLAWLLDNNFFNMESGNITRACAFDLNIN